MDVIFANDAAFAVRFSSFVGFDVTGAEREDFTAAEVAGFAFTALAVFTTLAGVAFATVRAPTALVGFAGAAVADAALVFVFVAVGFATGFATGFALFAALVVFSVFAIAATLAAFAGALAASDFGVFRALPAVAVLVMTDFGAAFAAGFVVVGLPAFAGASSLVAGWVVRFARAGFTTGGATDATGVVDLAGLVACAGAAVPVFGAAGASSVLGVFGLALACGALIGAGALPVVASRASSGGVTVAPLVVLARFGAAVAGASAYAGSRVVWEGAGFGSRFGALMRRAFGVRSGASYSSSSGLGMTISSSPIPSRK